MPATVTFLGKDLTTLGNWVGNWGFDGHSINSLTPSLPSYAGLVVTGSSTFVWSDPSVRPIALKKPLPSTERIEAGWFTATNMTFAVTLTGSAVRAISLYCPDFDGTNRQMRVDVYDPSDLVTPLNTQNLSGTDTNTGAWLRYQVNGSVTFKVTMIFPVNVVVAGIFFDTVATTGGTRKAAKARGASSAGLRRALLNRRRTR